MIPLKYNVRNLRVRWITTLMTVIGTGLVVWAMVLTFGLTDGLEHALTISGQPLDLIVLRKGANDETGSNIAQATADQAQVDPRQGVDVGAGVRVEAVQAHLADLIPLLAVALAANDERFCAH